MAVHHVLPQEIFPAHEDFDFVAGQQRRHVAPGPAHKHRQHTLMHTLMHTKSLDHRLIRRLHMGGWKRLAVHLKDEEFRKMTMDRMGPIVTSVAQGPDFGCALLDSGVDAVWVKHEAVDS